MPRISYFYGIGIWMYWDEGVHARPHFHARYAEHVASVDFTGEAIVGSLPTQAMRLVREWAQLHSDELAGNWQRAQRAEPLTSIAPLS